MLAIIDYGSGNLRSVAKAFERVAPDAHIQVTASPDVIRQASHIVLPGVGTFADCMSGLASLPDMLETLNEQVTLRKKNFLGICVGMQMLFETGHEHGVHKGLGWLEGEVVALIPSPHRGEVGRGASFAQSSQVSPHPNPPPVGEGILKIPHMGWNDLRIASDHPLLKNISADAQAYFVHSYHAQCKNPGDIIATTEYGQTIAAVVARGNIMGTQFHPEKSQETGLALLKNFVNL